MRGDGNIYLRGRIWWVRYYFRGKAYTETTRSENEKDAWALLKRRRGEREGGKLIGPRAERITFEELSDNLIADYRINRKRSLRSVELSIRHLKETFALKRAVDITTEQIRKYIVQRQEGGAANASINRELSALKRMFKLAIISDSLSRTPYIPMLEENNARQGFLEHADFLALRKNLPDYLKDPVTFLYLSGWRLGEMQTLEWRDVDLAGHVIRLRPQNSKTKTPRLLLLGGELLEVIQRAQEKRRLDCPLVFHTDRIPIGDFRKAWKAACTAAGLTGIIVHDLRRTAVRNMVRAGIPERVAMALSGHKTRSVFDRYNIVSESDLMEATERLQAHLETQPRDRKVASVAGG